MTVREKASAAVELLAEDAAAGAVRDVLRLGRAEVAGVAAPFVLGDSVVTLAAVVLGDDYVDYYAAAQVLGVKMPA